MKARKIEPCMAEVPEALQRAAAIAERRYEAALDRVLVKLDANGKGAALKALIDQDAELNGTES